MSAVQLRQSQGDGELACENLLTLPNVANLSPWARCRDARQQVSSRGLRAERTRQRLQWSVQRKGGVGW